MCVRECETFNFAIIFVRGGNGVQIFPLEFFPAPYLPEKCPIFALLKPRPHGRHGRPIRSPLLSSSSNFSLTRRGVSLDILSTPCRCFFPPVGVSVSNLDEFQNRTPFPPARKGDKETLGDIVAPVIFLFLRGSYVA